MWDDLTPASSLAGQTLGRNYRYYVLHQKRTPSEVLPSTVQWSPSGPLSQRDGNVGSMNVSILHDLDRKRCGGHMSTGPMAGTFWSCWSLKWLWSPIVWVC